MIKGVVMKKYRSLLFDADGTLLDFEAAEKVHCAIHLRNISYHLMKKSNKHILNLNQDLWKAHERGEIDRNTLIYTRFGKLFDIYHFDADGVKFEDDYQLALGEGHELINHAMEVVTTLNMITTYIS